MRPPVLCDQRYVSLYSATLQMSNPIPELKTEKRNVIRPNDNVLLEGVSHLLFTAVRTVRANFSFFSFQLLLFANR